MARTDKWEHPSDSYRVGLALERRARPAGRMLRILAAEAAADGDQSED